MNRIYEEIAAERKRQDEKWGEQNHSMISATGYLRLADTNAAYYKKCNERENKSWMNILLEEVHEVFAETDPVKQKEEMIKVCAVGVAIVEYLDRQIEGGK